MWPPVVCPETGELIRAMFVCGMGAQGPVLLSAESHLLVLGPPRCGKTSAVVVPNLLGSRAAAVVTSTKADIMLATYAARQKMGDVWLFDPAGQCEVPPGVQRLHFSPVDFAGNFSQALMLSRSMVRASVARGKESLSFWEERAEAALAPCLLGANLAGLGMDRVMDLIETKDLEPMLAMLASRGESEASRSLASVVASADRERSGVLSTAAGLLSAYRMPEVLRQAQSSNFYPDAFVKSRDTVYVVAPSAAQDVLSPLVVALIWAVRDAAYRQSAMRMADRGGAGPSQPSVALLLDEMANIAPIHDLGGILSEGAGQGVIVMGVLQDMSQARHRWPVASDGFMTLFGNTLVFPGIADPSTLRDISLMGGEKMVMMPSTGPRHSALRPAAWAYSGQMRPVMSPAEIAQGRDGEALLISARHGLSRVKIVGPSGAAVVEKAPPEAFVARLRQWPMGRGVFRSRP